MPKGPAVPLSRCWGAGGEALLRSPWGGHTKGRGGAWDQGLPGVRGCILLPATATGPHRQADLPAAAGLGAFRIQKIGEIGSVSLKISLYPSPLSWVGPRGPERGRDLLRSEAGVRSG